MRLKELGGAPQGRQLSAGVPPPNRRDVKLSSGLSEQVLSGGFRSEEAYFHLLLMTFSFKVGGGLFSSSPQIPPPMTCVNAA